MIKLLRDSYGILILDRSQIEHLAERFLKKVAPACLNRPLATPVVEIAERLQIDGHLSFRVAELGLSSNGQEYLGWYDVKEKVLSINQCLFPEDPRLPFTLAHELGHFYLHGKVNPRLFASNSAIIRDSLEDILLGRLADSNPLTKMEWQANRFASAILVPRITAKLAVVMAQRSKGIRTAGQIWLDGQPQNRRDYSDLVGRLSRLYRTSRAVIKIRLLDLGIVIEQKPHSQPPRIGEFLEDAMNAIFTGAPDE